MTDKRIDNPTQPPSTVRGILAGQWRAIAWGGGATLAVELAIFIAARLTGAGMANALVASLAVATIWIIIAAPVLAAGGRDWLAAALRAGVMADATGAFLLVVWVYGLAAGDVPGRLSFLGVLKLYVIFATMCLVAVALVSMAASQGRRYVLAMVCVMAMLMLAATPFWMNGLLKAAPSGAAGDLTTAAVTFNPVYSVMLAVLPDTGIVWHLSPNVMYHLTRIGEYNAPAPVAWYDWVWRFGAIAATGGGIGVILRRLVPPRAGG